MKTVNTWHGKYYYAEDRKDEQMLKDVGKKKVVSGIGQGAYVD